MEVSRAIAIVRCLANGMDPENGTGLDSESLLKRHEVIVALNRALGALIHEEERERSRPDNAGKTWDKAEDTAICGEISRGMTLHQIASLHRRSVGSIVVRLVKLGKIAPGKATRPVDLLP